MHVQLATINLQVFNTLIIIKSVVTVRLSIAKLHSIAYHLYFQIMQAMLSLPSLQCKSCKASSLSRSKSVHQTSEKLVFKSTLFTQSKTFSFVCTERLFLATTLVLANKRFTLSWSHHLCYSYVTVI